MSAVPRSWRRRLIEALSQPDTLRFTHSGPFRASVTCHTFRAVAAIVAMPLRRLYVHPGLSRHQQERVTEAANQVFGSSCSSVDVEQCAYVESSEPLSKEQESVLQWLVLDQSRQDRQLSESALHPEAISAPHHLLIEIGPRLNFTTPWSTNATTICHVAGITSVQRFEQSRRILLGLTEAPTAKLQADFVARLHDRMTECIFTEPLTSLSITGQPEPWQRVPVMEQGRKALEELNERLGLAFDEWDLAFYTDMFVSKFKRDPSDVECFDISQSNSEHSRHWFFKGEIIVEGESKPKALFELVIDTLKRRQENAEASGVPDNSAIAFADNSSSISGPNVGTLRPGVVGESGPMKVVQRDMDVTFTAETHNFPTGVAPFPGAATGTGGRLRDGFSTGRGSLVTAGTAGYSVGNLRIPGYEQPWEPVADVPSRLAPPLQIEIDASNGASNYGNEFGEPVVLGYTRSFGMELNNGERREYLKPIMFTGGERQLVPTITVDFGFRYWVYGQQAS